MTEHEAEELDTVVNVQVGGGPAANVPEPAVKVPVAFVLHEIVPVGVMAPAPPVSLTVAVQVVDVASITLLLGEHATVVVVGRAATTTVTVAIVPDN